MMGKTYFLLLALLMFSLTGIAQDQCYENLRKEGLRLARKQQYEPAINKYLAALNCPDKPIDDDLPKLIRKALQARVQQLEEARDTAAAMQVRAENYSKSALANKYIARSVVENTVNHNPSKALRFAELALEYDPGSAKAIEQYYNACYQPIYQYGDSYYRLAFPKRVFESDYGFMQASFDPSDDSRILSVGLDGMASWWNASSKERSLFSEGIGPLQCMALNEDGSLIVLGSKDGFMKMLRNTGEVLFTIQSHNNLIHSLNFSADNETVVSASWDGTVKVWNTEGVLTTDFQCKSSVYCADFTPDQQHILVGTQGHMLRIPATIPDSTAFDIDTLAVGNYYHFDISPDGQYIACTNKQRIEIRDLDGKLIENLIEAEAETPYWVSFSPNGQYLVAGGVDGLTRLWALAPEEGLSETVLTLSHDGVVNSVEFSPDGRYLLTASGDKTLRLWDLKMEEVKVIQHESPINVIDLYEQKYIFTTTIDSLLHIWDRNGTELLRFKPNSLNSAFIPHPHFSEVVEFGDNLGLWRIEESQVLGFSGEVYPVVNNYETQTIDIQTEQDTYAIVQNYYLPWQGDTIVFFDYITQEVYPRASGWDEKLAFFEDNIFYVHNMTTGQNEMKVTNWHTDDILYLLMAENILLVCSRDNTATLFILEGNTENIYNIIADHADAVTSISLHGSGDFYVTSSLDNTVKVWSTSFTKEWGKEYNLITTLRGHDDGVIETVLGLDDETIFSAGQDGKVILWDFYYPRSKLKAHIETLDVDIRPLREEDY